MKFNPPEIRRNIGILKFYEFSEFFNVRFNLKSRGLNLISRGLNPTSSKLSIQWRFNKEETLIHYPSSHMARFQRRRNLNEETVREKAIRYLRELEQGRMSDSRISDTYSKLRQYLSPEDKVTKQRFHPCYSTCALVHIERLRTFAIPKYLTET